MPPKNVGPFGFEKDYWDKLYKNATHIDGYSNGDAHAAYLKSLMYLDMVVITSIADLGFGLGKLFSSFIEAFEPARVLGIEPSKVAYDGFEASALERDGVCVKLMNTDVRSWALRRPDGWTYFDLGVATSIFQYLSNRHLEEVVPILAARFKWLYITIPTTDEYAFMNRQSGFHDPWAYSRSAEYYRSLFGKHFHFIGSRLLESKRAFKTTDSPFTEDLFRI
jgi:hypothetical protein